MLHRFWTSGDPRFPRKTWVLLATMVLIALNLSCGTSTPTPAPPEGELAKVAHVVDGDTVTLDDGRLVRYLGINTPEREQPFYQQARDVNRELVEGKQVRLVYDLQPIDRFGRTLAYLWLHDLFVNRELVRKGYASVYTEPPNVRYSAELLAAEQAAREEELGLWQPAHLPLKIRQLQYDAPGADQKNPNGEWIEVGNDGDQPVNLDGFTIKDRSNHIYTFPALWLRPGRTIRLHSGTGRDTDSDLYWGLVNDAVWNNDGDTAYLRDPHGRLVDDYTY